MVDPITSLIDDQISGLAEHGIDRACGITARNSGESLDTADDAYFLFVAPERLQRQRFRDLLAASARSFPVSLVVVDEAHCVSEWGHDFRTAYLNFGRTVRRVCDPSGLGAPPILALTGTASRAVLSDVLFQLGISGDSPDSIVSPASFDRPELAYEVRRTSPNLSRGDPQGRAPVPPRRSQRAAVSLPGRGQVAGNRVHPHREWATPQYERDAHRGSFNHPHRSRVFIYHAQRMESQ